MICLSSYIKYNAPKHFEVLRGKTSICVPVLCNSLFSYLEFAVEQLAACGALVPSRVDVENVLVEFRVILSVCLGVGDSLSRVLVELACDHVRHAVAPKHALLTQLVHMLLYKLYYGEELVFRVLKEAQKQLHSAVARTPAHAVICRIYQVYALTERLDSVCKCELLVVVGVYAYLLAVFVCHIKVFV